MRKIVFIAVLAALVILGSGYSTLAEDGLRLYCGAAFKKPMEEIIEVFKAKTNITIDAVYAGAPTLLNQMFLIKQGDLFLAPSPDIMEKGIRKSLVIPDSVRGLAFVVPCIDVQKGNPKHIMGLKDLLRPGVKVAMGNPEMVYIGALTVEIVQKALTEGEIKTFRSNVVTYAEDFNKLATFLALRQVDAVIGFHYLEGWYPDKIETVKLKAKEIPRIGASRIGVTTFSRNKERSQKFIDFVLSAESQKIFSKYHYFGSADEAFQWIGAKKPVGGEYSVPPEWIAK